MWTAGFGDVWVVGKVCSVVFVYGDDNLPCAIRNTLSAGWRIKKTLEEVN